MKRTRLRCKEFNEELARADYPLRLSKKDQVELIETEPLPKSAFKFIFINKEPSFFYSQDKLIPHLKFLQKNISTENKTENKTENSILKKITIDMGAVKFIVGGADIMRPGIKEIEHGIKKDEIVVVIDETHHKPLAIGIALFNGEEMQTMASGKVIKNIHYVGDEIWQIKL